MSDLPKKLYLHDSGYHTYITNGKPFVQNFKNVCITENNDPAKEHTDFLIFVRIWKETEKRDMQVSQIMSNSIEMASIGIEICAWIVELESSHGIEDDKIASLVKQFRTLARPKL